MSYAKEIYEYSELEGIIRDGIITDSFSVNSSNVNILKGVRKIKVKEEYGNVYFKELLDLGELEEVNCNFSFFGDMKSLNNLRYVGGTFRFGAPILSLGNLQEVKGDLRPTTNELKNLGRLNKVGGTLDLRGMVHLTDLSPLKEVGGNLNLVKSLKGQYNLNDISVKGKIIYWNKAPNYFQQTQLKNPRIKPPVWISKGPYEFENYLVVPSSEQKEFYDYFKASFLKGELVKVGGMRNYIRYLIYDLLASYKEDGDFKKLVKHYKLLRKHYPTLSHDTDKIETEVGRKRKIRKYTKTILPHEVYKNWIDKVDGMINEVLNSANLRAWNIPNAKLMEYIEIGYKNQNLTSFGKENSDAILNELIIYIREEEEQRLVPFYSDYFEKNKPYKTNDPDGRFIPNYYRKFFSSDDEYHFFLNKHLLWITGVPIDNVLFPKYIPPLVRFLIELDFKKIMRGLENKIREKRGLPKVGEGWISETQLYYKIKNEFNEYEVIHHGRPKWLGRQHFDIYFPEVNIAIEYQGAQHFEEVEIFGGKEGLEIAKKNDEIKKLKCKKNSCVLIEVFPNYNFDDVTKQIRMELMKTGIKRKS